ncbi:MAG: TRZ/ATZ family hydrolase [Pseudomonadota bacterium]
MNTDTATLSSHTPEAADFIINAGWIATVDANDTIIERGSIAVRNDCILGVCTQAEYQQRFYAEQIIDMPGHLLCPGFVNGHNHAAMSLLRGFADDLPLMTWLEQHIWPTESQYVDEEFAEDGVRLAIAEMLKSGTTCFTDMYFFPDITANLAHQYGVRAQVAFPVLELQTAWASGPEEYIDKGLQVIDDFKHSSFANVCFGPHAPYSVSRPTLEKVATLANELDANIHIHAHETEHEVSRFVAENKQRPIELLNEIGLASPRLQCAHMVHASDSDIDLLSATGTHVIHCVRSNLKLASGMFRLHDMLAAGVNVGLGTDGAASNNGLNLLSEMNISAIMAKAVAGKADAIGARQALRTATINGARAIGRDDSIGSLEAGKLADFFAIDINRIECQPMYEPVSHLVYSAQASHITDVWTAGEKRVSNGQLTQIDSDGLLNKANHWRAVLSS